MADDARHNSFPFVTILGVRVHRLSQQAAIEAMTGLVEAGEGCHQVVTVNPEFVMTAQRQPPFRDVINAADLALPDGIGVVWAARLFGCRRLERVTGVDSVEALCRWAAAHGRRPFLLGAAPGVAEQAAAVLQQRYPGLEIAGAYAGSPAPADADAILERVRIGRPDLLFVAYGAPQQDLWIATHREQLPVALAMGVGGTLDFLAGRVHRAPRWVRRLGLEWLYRLIREPWRWRRMLALPAFVARVLGAWLHGRLQRKEEAVGDVSRSG